MWRNVLRLFLVATLPLLFLHSANAQYYIPDYKFYPSTLDERAKIMSEPADNDFVFEVKKLVESSATSFTPIEGEDYYMDLRRIAARGDVAREKFEHDNLNPDQLNSLITAKTAVSADAAYEASKNLSPALHAYVAGAFAFNHDDFQHAVTYFIEAQKANDPQLAYKVWAVFMLGRSYAKLNMHDKAREQFALTRDIVTKGAPDPLGLAVTSYGEEARLALDEAGGVLKEEAFNPNQVNRLQKFHEAIRLYVLQAQNGSRSGLDSLHILCKEIKNQPSDFMLLMQDEMARRLFLAYVRGYNGGGVRNFSRSYNHRYHDPSSIVDARKTFITQLLKLFPTEDKEIADQLAASAYEVDDIDLTNHYLQQKQSAYSTWIKAKLALKAKDKEKAATLYEDAFQQQHQETIQPSLGPGNEVLAHERAILTLARGQFVKSFEEFYSLQTGNWEFLANRVLKIDELTQLTNKIMSERAKFGNPSLAGQATKEELKIWQDNFQMKGLEALTEHRLMRIGKYHEALAYTPDYESKQHIVENYVEWLDAAESASSKVDKAEGLYKAASIMRDGGWTLMGDELIKLRSPDADLTNDFLVTPEERDRMKDSRSETSFPPSFRRIATTEALQAADLVPPKSQAFAAILCHASGWVRALNEDESEQIYHRYVSQGAIVPWAKHFGHHCPDPNFTSAKYESLIHARVWAQRVSYRHPIIISSASVTVIILMSGALLYYRRKRNNSQYK